jgi:hypothetical protein
MTLARTISPVHIVFVCLFLAFPPAKKEHQPAAAARNSHGCAHFHEKERERETTHEEFNYAV